MPGPELAGEHPGELVQAGLAGRVGVDGKLWYLQAVDAADVDHPGRVVGGSSRLEQRQERPGEIERRLEVEVDDLVPGATGKVRQGRAPGGAGIVDQDVDSILGPADLGGQPDAFLLAGQVGREGYHAAVRGELGDRGLPRLGLARADVDRRSGLQQAARHHQADPAGSPGDDGDLAGEIEQVQDRPSVS
jgi:hypothetical protein